MRLRLDHSQPRCSAPRLRRISVPVACDNSRAGSRPPYFLRAIRQSLNDRTLERRDHIELQINRLAEREATQSLRILQRIAKKLDVKDVRDGSPDDLASETSVDQIAQDLKDREDEAEKMICR